MDTLVDALKEAEKRVQEQTSEQAIRDQVQARDNATNTIPENVNNSLHEKRISIAEQYSERVNNE